RTRAHWQRQSLRRPIPDFSAGGHAGRFAGGVCVCESEFWNVAALRAEVVDARYVAAGGHRESPQSIAHAYERVEGAVRNRRRIWGLSAGDVLDAPHAVA